MFLFLDLKKHWLFQVKARTDGKAKKEISSEDIYSTHLIPISKDEFTVHTSHSIDDIYVKLINLSSFDDFFIKFTWLRKKKKHHLQFL